MALTVRRKPCVLLMVVMLLISGSHSQRDSETTGQPTGSSSCCNAYLPGHPGIPGIPGNPGGIGGQGPIGPKGDPGFGLPGPKGQGQTGDQGRKGDKGETGMQGPSGKLGPAGRDGQKGGQGAPGDWGQQGIPGEKGQSGEAAIRAPTAPSAFAFSAYLTSSVTGNGGDVIIFDNIMTNIGDSYDSQLGVFTCSQPGLYFFTTSFLSSLTATQPDVRLKKNDELIFSVYDNHGGYHHQSSNSAVLNLATGDRVWLEFGSSNRGIYSDGGQWSYFSGFFICAV